MTLEEYYDLKEGDWVQMKNTKSCYKLTGCNMGNWMIGENVWISKEALIKNFNLVKDTEKDYKTIVRIIPMDKMKETFTKFKKNMESKEMKIIAPDGYEIDRENSTLDCIGFKKIGKPKSWEEYCKMMEGEEGYRTDTFGEYKKVGRWDSTAFSTFSAPDESKAFCALGKLIQLRDAWVGDWRPDWNNEKEIKYTLLNCNNEVQTSASYICNSTISFPTEEMRDKFFKAFKDLLEDAKMFL